MRLFIVILLFPIAVAAQPNCEAFKFAGDSLRYKACKVSEGRKGHYQFSKEYQTYLDKALAIDPNFDYAYRAKSVAYLKSGDAINWKILIDKAVELNPEEHLGYRGWCRYQFFRDYKGAILDIERLSSMVDYDIGYSANGDYHLEVARALCYKALDQPEVAIKILENHLEEQPATKFDHLHLGVLYLEAGDHEKAKAQLYTQQDLNDVAEVHYYLAKALLADGKKSAAMQEWHLADNLYRSSMKMTDPYTHPMDQVYYQDLMALRQRM